METRLPKRISLHLLRTKSSQALKGTSSRDTGDVDKFRVSRLHVLLGGRVWTSPFLDLRHSFPELEAAVFEK